MKIKDFNNCTENMLTYGGHAGAKLGIIIDGENWFLKFPKSTRTLRKKVDMSYSTSPLSEYIGSHIYESIDIPVHKTMLGVRDNKLVVACKDFRNDISKIIFEDYNSIYNIYVSGLDEKLSSITSSSNHTVDLNEIMIIMENNPRFINTKGLKDRFWDMFIVDALIGNNDRNNGNWGVLINNDTKKTEIAPVFDNGASFGNNTDDLKIEKILSDKERFKNSAYLSRICAFSINDKIINPFKYIESLENDECNKALLRIVPKIDLSKIYDIINDIPNEYEGIKVISDIRKKYYFECIKYRYENSLYKTYLELLEKNK